MKKKLLTTGANGMLGGTLVRLYQEKFEVYATGTKKYSLPFVEKYKDFDLRSDSYGDLVEWCHPDIVIHCAALTNGNYCQQNPLEAFEVNAVSLKRLLFAVRPETRIIFISTDAVFSSRLHMASEKDCPCPENVYGKSKELGEFFLINSEAEYTIVRTTIVGLNFNASKAGFAEWIINSSKKQEEISLFDDVLFCPITIWDLAEQLEHIVNSGPAYSKKILHIAGKKPCTKYQFGIDLLNKLSLPAQHVRRGSINEMSGRAKRSTDQTLSCSYYESLARTELPNLDRTTTRIKENCEYYEKYKTGK